MRLLEAAPINNWSYSILLEQFQNVFVYRMDEIDRLGLLFKLTNRSKKSVLAEAGVDYARFADVQRRKVALRAGELRAIADCFPEYKYWLVFGEELPEAGQISPMTNEAKERLGAQGKVG